MKFEVLEPRTLDEAVFLLSKCPEETRVIAGGQSLLLMIRAGLVMPRFLLSLSNVKELGEIRLTPEKNVYIGATVTHRKVLNSQLLSQQAAILLQAVFRIGSRPVLNRTRFSQALKFLQYRQVLSVFISSIHFVPEISPWWA